MRLDRLDLTRYGRFTDKSLEFAPPAADGTDLHILYGPNEAGKSTLYSAWMDLLFGIPTRSRYDFLHPGPSMQLGARLSEAGRVQEVRRLKRNTGSLLDGHGAVLPEPVLQAMLGGLSRDGYAAMFSLDDDTLEKGGEGILASRGDLGQMLFSASAGLAELTPRLGAIRSGLDGFYNGKRSGVIFERKKQLEELKARRRALELSATAVKTLAREVEQTEEAWRAARQREADGASALEALKARAAQLPLLQRRARLLAELAPLADLPSGGGSLQADFDAIEARRLALEHRARDRETRRDVITARIAGLALDPGLVAASEAISAAEALRPEHDTALRDLPRRAAEVEEMRSELRRVLAELGQSEAMAADLLLPPARIAELRALLELRSGTFAAAETAEQELRAATTRLREEEERLGDLVGTGAEAEETVLATLLTELRSEAPAERQARAALAHDEAVLRRDRALRALSPWQGTAAELAALSLPDAAQITAWQSRGTGFAEREEAAQRALLALDLRLEALHPAIAAPPAPMGFTLADAAEARSRREALWAAHRAALSTESAARFEQALREDDRLSALLAEALSGARRQAEEAAEAARLAASRSAIVAELEEARAGQDALGFEIAALGARLNLPGLDLSGLATWMGLRAEALALADQAAETGAALARADQVLSRAAISLCAALGAEPHPYDLALATARARVAAADQRREARRLINGLERERAQRDTALQAAKTARAAWQARWDQASAETPLRGLAGAGAGPILDRLEQLGGLLRGLAVLEDRMAKMAANRDRFKLARSAATAAIAVQETSWEDVLARLRRAQDAARDHALLEAGLQAETQQEAEDFRQRNLLDQQAAALGASVGWRAETGTLRDHLALCLKAEALRRELADLAAELNLARAADAVSGAAPGAAAPLPLDHTGGGTTSAPQGLTAPFAEDGGDPAEGEAAALRPRIAALQLDLQLRRDESERCHAAHLTAVQALQAVGGDDGLARIAAERAALLEELAEEARRHLSGRFGLLAVETALARYRDLHRSAMLARASEAFGRLSNGAYAGLAAQPEGTQEVLVAIAAGGATKLAADLSKGTRFQLYLALRIAGYHELAKSRPTVPFVADDIMETFDDGRSLAAFGLLGEMSQAGQVIYLTHHRHLCDLALEACPAARIIELQAI